MDYRKFLIKHLLSFHKNGIILFGHGLCEGVRDDFLDVNHIEFESFKKVIDYFVEIRLKFLSMDDLLKMSKNNFSSKYPWIHLTFDDGYRSNFTTIYPYLKEKDIPFTVYVSTYHIASGELFYSDRVRCALLYTKLHCNISGTNYIINSNSSREERIQIAYDINTNIIKKLPLAELEQFMKGIDSLLNPSEWAECIELHKSLQPMTLMELKTLSMDQLISIGSHNHHHIVFSKNSKKDDVTMEMLLSQNWLSNNLNIKNMTYCYPNGKTEDFSNLTKLICKSLGYQIAFTTIFGCVRENADLYEIPRIGFPPTIEKATRMLLKAIIPQSVLRIIIRLRNYLTFCILISFYLKVYTVLTIK